MLVHPDPVRVVMFSNPSVKDCAVEKALTPTAIKPTKAFLEKLITFVRLPTILGLWV